MFKQLGIFAILVGFLAFAVGASPVLDEDEFAEINTPAGMVLIPAGQFQMGSDDEDARLDEQPVHTVHLDAFYMDEYEVHERAIQGLCRRESTLAKRPG